MSIKVIEINQGTKIHYEVTGTKICFDDDLTINLAKRQEDWDVHIDVCSDDEGALVIGAKSGSYYVAQLDIPAKEYEETEAASEDIVEDQQSKIIRTAKPLDMDTVTLTLWALENYSE